jgi:hypothetical protein
MVTVSRAPLPKLDAFNKRMGWSFKWVSSYGNDFNWDYHVSFSPEDVARKKVYYNYHIQSFPAKRRAGHQCFYRDEDGTIFHTYSSFSRGLDMFIVAYHLLDIVPKGAMSPDSPTGWSGCDTMIGTKMQPSSIRMCISWHGSEIEVGVADTAYIDNIRDAILSPFARSNRRTPLGVVNP